MSRYTAAITAIVLTVGLLGALPGGATGTLSAEAPADCAEVFCAGAASVDMTWHTGSGQGQLGSTRDADPTKFDPFHHSVKMVPTDGIQSRTFAKALVLRGSDGRKIAYVKTELYLQQDLMTRRVAELVTGADPLSDLAVDGLEADGIMLGGTHNHSAPHHTSTAWGVWVFADSFDFRAFEHTARRIAESIKAADEALEPARVGANVVHVTDVQQNILGPATADDGSPAGFPRDHFDPELAVIRVDARDSGAPIGAIVNFANHPESISGVNLISSDFIGIVERDVERALGREPGAPDGPVVAWSQGGLGDVEPDNLRASPRDEGRAYWRKDFAQAERMSEKLTEHVLRAWHGVATGDTDAPEKAVALTDDPVIDALSYRFPGPVLHPTPTVSNCRTEHPGIPVLGFPDCLREGELPEQYGTTVQLLRDAGLPIPSNYGVPTHGSVQEAPTVHLQVLRIDEILLAGCPCEPITDMTLNFKSRADAAEGNLFNGYEWECRDPDPDADTVECDFRHAAFHAPDWRPVPREAYELMRAQVTHDAAGWEDDPALLFGEADPVDVEDIRGNFTHSELDAETGFRLPLMVGKANDYVGYVVTYREHQRGDHYRKALTPLGPYSADFINTRLVSMAAELRGGPATPDARETLVETVDELIQSGKARVVGGVTQAGTTAYEAALPDDGGTPGLVIDQPAEVIERFDAATLTWEGGSNYTDNPAVVVQRWVPGVRAGGAPQGQPGELPPGEWRTVATQEGGEVVLTLAYESLTSSAPLDWLVGGKAYTWTATFEVFDATEPGRYRFVVDGHHRDGRQANPYQVVSDEFQVAPWSGIRVTDLTVEGDTAAFGVAGIEAEVPAEEWVGPVAPLPGDRVRYPSTYDADLAFLSRGKDTQGANRFCYRCTFRAWALHGAVVEAVVTVERADGTVERHAAAFDGTRWVAGGLDLADGDQVRIAPGDVRDEHGNTNGGAYPAAGP